MIALEIRFLAGRYHATPWGHHVNEGVPEWPPAPYRIVRALHDVWMRKRPAWPADRVVPLLAALAGEPPRYRLPPGRAAHTRAFLPGNAADGSDRRRVLDPFVALDPSAPVTVGWEGAALAEGEARDLAEMAGLLDHLGRSESWVAVRLLAPAPAVEWNCLFEAAARPSPETEEVRVACLVPPEEYAAHRGRLRTPAPAAGRGRRRRPVPATWIEAVAASTSDLLDGGLGAPPALREVRYVRPAGSLEGPPAASHPHAARPVHGVLYALAKDFPPPITAALPLAEGVRRSLMGIHRAVVGDPARVSRKFAGKDPAGRPLAGHRHAFFLPHDRDGDGRIDHILVCSADPFDPEERVSLGRLDRVLRPGGGGYVACVPVRWGDAPSLAIARTFRSRTPFVPPRHHRRGRGTLDEWLAAEVCREAAHHGLPAPAAVRSLGALDAGSRTTPWLAFRRRRKDEPDRPGYGFEIAFDRPLPGPFALGRGCHFGLGQFWPAGEEVGGR